MLHKLSATEDTEDTDTEFGDRSPYITRRPVPTIEPLCPLCPP
jgi:hypothetical protein